MLKKATCSSSIATGDVLKERNGNTIYIILKTGDGQRWTGSPPVFNGAQK